MRERLELKAALRRDRIKGKARRPSVTMSRDPDKPLEQVPTLRIGALRIKTENRQGTNARGNAFRTPPPRTRG